MWKKKYSGAAYTGLMVSIAVLGLPDGSLTSSVAFGIAAFGALGTIIDAINASRA